MKKLNYDVIKIASFPVGQYPEIKKWFNSMVYPLYTDNHTSLTEDLFCISDLEPPKKVKKFLKKLPKNIVYIRFEEC